LFVIRSASSLLRRCSQVYVPSFKWPKFRMSFVTTVRCSSNLCPSKCKWPRISPARLIGNNELFLMTNPHLIVGIAASKSNFQTPVFKTSTYSHTFLPCASANSCNHRSGHSVNESATTTASSLVSDTNCLGSWCCSNCFG
jgi:hypothetical protein